jgi:hypothetical protein
MHKRAESGVLRGNYVRLSRYRAHQPTFAERGLDRHQIHRGEDRERNLQHMPRELPVSFEAQKRQRRLRVLQGALK